MVSSPNNTIIVNFLKVIHFLHGFSFSLSLSVTRRPEPHTGVCSKHHSWDYCPTDDVGGNPERNGKEEKHSV